MVMLQGTVEIEVVDVQTLEIHGSPYYDIRFKAAGSETVQQMRVNPEAFYPDPQPGDRASVNWLMGNILGASKLS